MAGGSGSSDGSQLNGQDVGKSIPEMSLTFGFGETSHIYQASKVGGLMGWKETGDPVGPTTSTIMRRKED